MNLETALQRNSSRDDQDRVSEGVIRRMIGRMDASYSLGPVSPLRPFEQNTLLLSSEEKMG